MSKEEIDEIRNTDKDIAVIRFVGSPSKEHINRIGDELSECANHPKYISIDLDFIDPAYAPGVQTPEPLGASPMDL